MYRFLRWVVWIAGIFFFFIIVGIIAVQIFLSSDEVIKIAEREGQELLGRKVSIERLDVGLFKIKASGVVIDEKREKVGAKGKPFARFSDVEVLLNPSTLIYKHISILQLTIKGVFAHVSRDANGRFNFQDIIDNLNRRKKKTNPARAKNIKIPFSFTPSAEAAESGAQSVEPGFGLTIHELDFHDVTSEFRFGAGDVMPAFDASCSFAHIEVDKIKPGEPLDVFLDGKCQKPDERLLIQLKGGVHIDTNGRSYRASLEMPLFDLSLMAAMLPITEGYRLWKGIFTGNLKFDYFAGRSIAWNLDLKGETIQADFKVNRQAKWRKFILPRLKLKTKGQYDLFENSARIGSFFLETPFVNVNLTKPSFWNVSTKDEIHLEANVHDMGGAGSWISRITDTPIRGFKKSTAAKIAISARRDRKIPDDVVQIEVTSHFDPIDLAQFNVFIPLFDNVSKIKGNMGGKAHVVFVSGERVQWDVALKVRDVGASVRLDKRKRWEVVQVGESLIRSRGSFDIKNTSARISIFEIKLPFATARLAKPAKWNVSGDDEAALSIEVNDLSSASNLLERLGLVSPEDVSKGAKIRFSTTVSRNRKNSLAFKIDTNAQFDSLPIAPFADLVLLPWHVQKATGRVSGELQLSLAHDGVVRWNMDIAGQKVDIRAKTISNEKWRDVFLESISLQSQGSYLPLNGSSEIQTLDLELPFARAYLNHAALWNQRRRDGFSLTLNVTDLSAAEVWLGKLMGHPVKWGPKGEELKILLSGTRNRKNGPGFSYKGSASFDPVHISPLVKFVSLPPAFRDPVGEIGGKIDFYYSPRKKVSWSLGLRSDDLGGEFLGLISQRWKTLRAGKINIQAAGSYDFLNQSARVQTLNLVMPFGRIQMLKPADWNMHGMDLVQFQWTISSLRDVTSLVGSILGEQVSKLLMAGSAEGLIEISRDRQKTRSISSKWSVAANLKSLAHVDYPNLNVSGNISGQLSNNVIEIWAPELKINDFSRPNAEPDVILQDLRALLDRSSLMRGEIRSPNIRMKTLKVRYMRHAKRKSNFESLLEKSKGDAKRAQQIRSDGKGKTVSGEKLPTPPLYSKTKTASRKRQNAQKKAKKPLLPILKIAKFEIEKMEFHFEDFIASDKPPVVLRVKDARLLMTNLDTAMVPNLRETHLEFKTFGESPSIFAEATLNPGLVPPDVDGSFNLSRFDLRKISPYARDIQGETVNALLMRGTEITGGKLDFTSTYSLRNKQLKLDGRAKITGLRLKPDEKSPLADLVLKLLRASVFRLLEGRNNTISLNVRVEGRLDDPEFHFLDAIVEPIFVSLFEKVENLGENVKDIITDILGTAIKGVQKIVPKPESGGRPPEKDSGKEPGEEGHQLKRLGKKLEKTLERGLRGLFGVK